MAPDTSQHCRVEGEATSVLRQFLTRGIYMSLVVHCEPFSAHFDLFPVSTNTIGQEKNVTMVVNMHREKKVWMTTRFCLQWRLMENVWQCGIAPSSSSEFQPSEPDIRVDIALPVEFLEVSSKLLLLRVLFGLWKMEWPFHTPPIHTPLGANRISDTPKWQSNHRPSFLPFLDNFFSLSNPQQPLKKPWQSTQTNKESPCSKKVNKETLEKERKDRED